MIHTPRLNLRRITSSDLEAIVKLHNDAQVMRYISPPQPRSVVENTVIPQILTEYVAADVNHALGFGVLAITAKGSGNVLGLAALKPIHSTGLEVEKQEDSVLEMGFRLLPSAWGKGYATEVGLAVLQLAFSHGARKVVATAMVANVSSCRVLERIGMHKVRVFHWKDASDEEPLPGAEHGDAVYVITNDGESTV